MITSRERPWVQFYQPGVPAEIELPTKSLVDMCFESIKDAGKAPALEFFGRVTSYEELGQQILRLAEGLRRLGVKAKDRVALILPNCPQHVVAFYAVLRLGAIVVEHNPLYSASELRHIFEDHRAETIICWDKSVNKIADLPKDLGVKNIISVNLTEQFPLLNRWAIKIPFGKFKKIKASLTTPAPDAIPWKKVIAASPISASYPSPKVHDLACLQYTSGTTGGPKGAMLTHFNLYSNALQGWAWMHGAQKKKENFYCLIPMFHSFGMTLYVTYGILIQSRLVIFPKFDVDMVLKAAKKTPPTVYCGVPPIYRRTAEAAIEQKVKLDQIKYCISGAMTLSDDIVELWEKVTPSLLVEGYGLTECSPVALGNPFHPSKRTGTIGIPFPSTERKVVNPDNLSEEVPQGTPGELLVKGPQVFAGYWNDPEESSRVLLSDGWLRTGDIVTLDADGFATIVDRIKEIIIVNGFNVYPSEVEKVLRLHDSIEDVAVVGRPLDDGSESVVAVIVVSKGKTVPNIKELRDFCRDRLAGYKIPREILELPSLPHSLLGKVLRKEIRQLVKDNE